MFPFVAAITQAAGIIIDKVILTRRQVEIHVFIPILFLFLFLLTAILFPFLGEISDQVFKPYYLIIFSSMLIAAATWNFFYYRGVQSQKVHEFELIIMFQPLLTILLASFFLSGERNLHLEIAALIAALALIFAHIKKTHFEISKGSAGLILAVVFMSIEIILIRIMLDVFSPVALYFVRTGILFLLFMFIYRPHLAKVANSNFLLIFMTSLLGTTQMVTKFYGFQELGVIYTSLILILAPILVYFASTIFLHERLKPRIIIAATVILGCIVYATVMMK